MLLIRPRQVEFLRRQLRPANTAQRGSRLPWDKAQSALRIASWPRRSVPDAALTTPPSSARTRRALRLEIFAATRDKHRAPGHTRDAPSADSPPAAAPARATNS